MRFSSLAAIGLAVAIGLGAPVAVNAQTDDAAAAFVRVATSYSLSANITYQRAGGQDLTLDVYRSRAASEPAPTLIYIHGGGWTNGSRQSSALTFLPYLEMGWNVVNVSYRLAGTAHAPAAVEDCRCALRWVYRNAEQFNFDLDRIVVTGNSAGGHLSLTTGMLPASAGLDRQCPGDRNRMWPIGPPSTAPLKVAAIINWYGITDVYDLAHRTPGTSGNFTEAWLGSRSDRDDVARRVSPTNYVHGDTPPILTIHGDADSIVALRPRHAAARDARCVGRAEPAHHHRGRRPRRVQPRREPADLRGDPGVPRRARPGGCAVERLSNRLSAECGDRLAIDGHPQASRSASLPALQRRVHMLRARALRSFSIPPTVRRRRFALDTREVRLWPPGNTQCSRNSWPGP